MIGCLLFLWNSLFTNSVPIYLTIGPTEHAYIGMCGLPINNGLSSTSLQWCVVRCSRVVVLTVDHWKPKHNARHASSCKQSNQMDSFDLPFIILFFTCSIPLIMVEFAHILGLCNVNVLVSKWSFLDKIGRVCELHSWVCPSRKVLGLP